MNHTNSRTRGTTQNALHVRFAGRSYSLALSDLDVAANASDQAVKEALARFFDVSPAKLAAYVVERHGNGNLTVRPEAVFG